MLKIEVIKFEAQDVITSSVAAPVEPEIKDDPKCACEDNGCRISTANTLPGQPRDHILPGYLTCKGVDGSGVHTCGKE